MTDKNYLKYSRDKKWCFDDKLFCSKTSVGSNTPDVGQYVDRL